MKKGWEYKTLKEIGYTQTGSTPSMSHKEYYGDFLPFVKPPEIDFDKKGGIYYEAQKLSEIGARHARVFDKESIFMVCIGSIGKLGISNRRVSCNQQINVLTPYDSIISKYVYYAMLNPIFIEEVTKIAKSSQATLPIISKGKWEKLSIPVPPLSEQEEIVSRLDRAFEKIDTLRRNAEKSLTTAQQLFQSSLTNLLTPQPHWQRKTLRELCEKSVNIKWDEVSQEKTFVYIDLTAVNRETKRIEQTQQIDSINAPSRAKQIVTRGDVLFATTRPTLRRVCIVPDVFNGQICSTGFCVLRPKKDLLSEYLLFKLQEDDFYKYIEPLQTGANYPAVTDSIVKRYSIYVPPLTEQATIVTKLDSLSAKVKQLKDNYTRTVALCDEMKQALLKEVFE